MGITVEEIKEFLEIDKNQQRIGGGDGYGTFWKRFMKFIMEKKVAVIPTVSRPPPIPFLCRYYGGRRVKSDSLFESHSRNSLSLP